MRNERKGFTGANVFFAGLMDSAFTRTSSSSSSSMSMSDDESDSPSFPLVLWSAWQLSSRTIRSVSEKEWPFRWPATTGET